MTEQNVDIIEQNSAPTIGLIAPDTATLTAVLAAINMVGVVEPPPALPKGELGGCVACGRTAASHFADGRWTGCLRGQDNDAFILVPARIGLAHIQQTAAPRRERRVRVGGDRPAVANEVGLAEALGAGMNPSPAAMFAQHRAFRRARYHSKLHHAKSVEKMDLTPTRAKVLAAIHASGKTGVLAKQVMKRTKLPHGSIQQTLHWLRQHDMVEAVAVKTKAA